jgi:hypothetical protein
MAVEGLFQFVVVLLDGFVELSPSVGLYYNTLGMLPQFIVVDAIWFRVSPCYLSSSSV